MVNTASVGTPLRPLVTAYVAAVAATVVALVVLSAAGSAAATQDAWVHAIVLAGFAVLLPLRLRARAYGAVAVIAGVLAVANLVEAVLPGVFPTWMRVEMLGLVALTALIALAAVAARRDRG